MQIGEAELRASHISQAYPDRVEVRGRDLSADLMGRLSFTEYFHLLLTGREPTDDQRFFLDVLLVSIAEHGMMPTNVAARMTLAADPGSLQGAVAAGILGCGPVLLGTAEECAKLLVDARARAGDPRRRHGRVGQAADHERVDADRGRAARPRLRRADGEGDPDPGADGEPPRPPRRGARAADRVPDGRRRRARDRLQPAGMSADAAYREQLAYLVERSPFYRDKLAGHDAGGGLDEIASLPLTTKQELRATVSAAAPMGAHVCVARAEIARIYSTSGTTGTPSYIPLTA